MLSSNRLSNFVPGNCVIDVQSYSSKNVAGERFGYVKVNGEVVLNGSCDGKQGPNRPGIHTLILHPLTCSVGRWRWFNTHNSSTEAENFVDYLFGHGEHSLRTGLVAIVVSFDDGFENLTDNVFDALKISGVDIRDVKCYGQFAFITQVGYSGYPGKLKFSKDPAHDDCKALKLSAQIQGISIGILGEIWYLIPASWGQLCLIRRYNMTIDQQQRSSVAKMFKCLSSCLSYIVLICVFAGPTEELLTFVSS